MVARKRKEAQENSPLTPQQEVAVTLLASGKKAVDVALELQVSASQISRWKRQPEFMAALNQALWDAREAVQHQLVELGLEAINTLKNVMADEKAPATARIEAAQTALKMLTLTPKPGSIDANDIRREQNAENLNRLIDPDPLLDFGFVYP